MRQRGGWPSQSPQPATLGPVFPCPLQGIFADLVTLLICIAVLRGLSDRLAADSPLLLLDVDVVHSIASVLSQPCRIMLAGLCGADATTLAVPTIPEIVWPTQIATSGGGRYATLDDDMNTPVYQCFDTGAVQIQLGAGSLNLGGGSLLSDGFGLDLPDDDGLDLPDDDDGLGLDEGLGL